MRILVTGGSGFIGTAFRRIASEAGHSVASLNRTDAGGPGVEIAGNIADPPWADIEKFSPEVCVHAAWIATPRVYLESPANSDWARWSEEFLMRMPSLGVRSIIGLGSCIEYAVDGTPLSETTTVVRPQSAYARAKHQLYQNLRRKLEFTGIPLTWARIFYPYGEGEHPDRFISTLIRRLRLVQRVALMTPGSIKDYIHIDDVAAALLKLVEVRFDGPINVGSGEGVAIETLARLVALRLDRPDLIDVPASPARDPLDYVVADVTRLRALGWRQTVTLEQGLERMIAK